MQSTPPNNNPSSQVTVFPQQDQISTNVFLKLDFFFGDKTNKHQNICGATWPDKFSPHLGERGIMKLVLLLASLTFRLLHVCLKVVVFPPSD